MRLLGGVEKLRGGVALCARPQRAEGDHRRPPRQREQPTEEELKRRRRRRADTLDRRAAACAARPRAEERIDGAPGGHCDLGVVLGELHEHGVDGAVGRDELTEGVKCIFGPGAALAVVEHRVVSALAARERGIEPVAQVGGPRALLVVLDVLLPPQVAPARDRPTEGDDGDAGRDVPEF